MRSFAQIEANLDQDDRRFSASQRALELLGLGEETMEHWIRAKGNTPTIEQIEGFRLLALHRQGAKGDPSFNASRESCRELVYHYNLICLNPDDAGTSIRLTHMNQLARHLLYFVSGKMQEARVGEFCCSSRAVRLDEDAEEI